uniref:Integrase catalytic domain-containing protein n=1 Tax=Strongyloides venezuelensis TaxID=75913 RepID=A0A0K0FIL3_STRVS
MLLLLIHIPESPNISESDQLVYTQIGNVLNTLSSLDQYQHIDFKSLYGQDIFVRINVLRRRVEQVTRHLLPPVTVTETFQFYSTMTRNAFHSSYSDTLASDKSYKFKVDMKSFVKSFVKSLTPFKNLAKIVIANYPETDKLNSIKDRLKCQLISNKYLYKYVRDFDESPVTLFRHLVYRYNNEKLRRQTVNAGKFSRYASFSRFKSIKCYHCQISEHTSDQFKRKIKVLYQKAFSGLKKQARNRSETPRVFVTVYLNLLFATSLLDGGSDVSIINKELAKQVDLFVLNYVESIITLAGKCQMVLVESPVSLQINDRSRITLNQPINHLSKSHRRSCFTVTTKIDKNLHAIIVYLDDILVISNTDQEEDKRAMLNYASYSINFELTIPNKHTSNGVAERAIRTRRLLLKKYESTFREKYSFQRRVTGERPRDLIFVFSIHSTSRDSEDMTLKNLKIETLQYINDPAAYKIYKQGKPETAISILQSVNENDGTVKIKSKKSLMIKKPVLKIKPLE